MALHEPATNATTYGALACEAVRVRIVWRTASGAPGQTLHLCSSEHGAPDGLTCTMTALIQPLRAR